MKGFLRKLELPEFVKDTRLTASLIIVLVLSLLGAIIGMLISPLFGLAMVLLFILTVIFAVYGIYVLAGNTNNYAANLSYRIKRGEQEAMIKMPLGIMLYDKDRQIQWINPYLQMYLHDKDIIGSSISSVDKELAKYIDDAIKSNSKQNKIIKWGDRKFEMVVQDDLGVVYLLDITRYANIEEKYKQERLAIGLIFIDNYDELSQAMGDQNLTNMSSYVQTTLSKYAGQFNSYLKRIDEDHFILLTHMHDLAKMEDNKFSILDKVRTESSRKNMPLTLSIGIAFGSESLNEIADQAQSNLDLALGRGGDQVVVKQSGHEARFYGGKSNPMEKRTRVRARMVSQALVELFKGVDHVFVQGHRNPDLDAIGSAIGIVKIARIHGVKASVVVDVDHVNYDVGRLIAKMQAAGIDKDVFISPKDALEAATDESLLVLTDHSKYSITYDPELYKRLKNRLIIIDHHRRGEEFPENPMLVYIEPYASSTCELVTEMIEYQPQGGEGVLTDLEASAMLAGITVDSKEFSLRTGTRTFDAASYLRSIGADTQVVSELLKENIDNYLQRSHLVSTIDMIEPNMALLMGEDNKIYDPIITAQAADTALSLEHVDASFALTRRSKDVIGISARSMGNVNVQVIMEKLGGGGHLSNAATQIKGVTVEEAKDKLLAAINEYLKENE
ncbi:DHH family phosphoesterase [Lactobacillus gasseri ATCC 33323 = JCM 1131]|jgi:c-di-AMP phosphodiesterase-like protein|uniref:Cyclic-di-AMP phosphodiesterase n=1 Tax=Lactobacillus gasseri (strain ATCC 33323 / DSM 20243 / BCRC 14619 / CIP 102991 / JCM 1131 / KCTC 3163 / NCIMB 11718 / NCTC 13722 / AM63) TaxID=324831 RepID=A0A805ZLS7_LACGA|nr:DHH family phosphoesterase [Lactobacillus gasseri]ABJ59428.1 Signaling protein (consists of PAS, a modified GGDEF and a DHH family phosphatase domains) [Lactobacillus gasseri ATCC 33323 = JCM 1131]KAB1920045.1 diguanylate cyclase [Lactobacillus gasseri ATCC 33323 = JCM 1131]MDG9740783.1 DHH family phosphoesterase [Lactobacillus gasseri ATCC 33323 = JCM 1131]MDQ4446679.1 DHH family phosphoesterase [Lactobacillus gasseri]STX21058.1 signal protein [Lactobacillus gasseri]